jgi:hypothetical protein
MPDRAPYFNLAQYTWPGQSNSNFQFEPTNVLSLQPNIAIVHGKHTAKAGIDFRTTRYGRFNSTYSGGELSFDQGFTQASYLTADAASGNAAASMLSGYAASGAVSLTVDPAYQWVYYAPWVQDDIRVNRRLNISLGVRWDLVSPVTERYNQLNRGFNATAVNPISSMIDQTNFPGYKVYGGLGFAGVNGAPRSPYNRDWNNIQPRLGFAFFLNSKTVMRGGWGIYYLSPSDVASSNGFIVSTPFVASPDSNRTPSGDISNPFPNGLIQPSGSRGGLATFLGQAPTFADPTGKVPYVHQFSFGFQRQLPGQMTLDIAWVGSRSNQLWINNKGVNALSLSNLALGDPNQGGNPNYLTAQVPNPFAGLIPGTSLNNATVARSQLLLRFPEFTSFNELSRNDGAAWYNAMQVSVTKVLSHGLSFQANYSLSKNIQQISWMNPQDAYPGRSLTPWDQAHRLATSPMYELPFGPGVVQRSEHAGVPWNPVLTPTDPNFGALIRDNGQSNSPRQIQLRCRLTF